MFTTKPDCEGVDRPDCLHTVQQGVYESFLSEAVSQGIVTSSGYLSGTRPSLKNSVYSAEEWTYISERFAETGFVKPHDAAVSRDLELAIRNLAHNGLFNGMFQNVDLSDLANVVTSALNEYIDTHNATKLKDTEYSGIGQIFQHYAHPIP